MLNKLPLRTAPKNPLAKANEFDRRNLESAREILRDAQACGGVDALPAIWARAVVARLGKKESRDGVNEN